MVAKKKEVDALSTMIEQKLTRVGDHGVEIQEMKNDRDRYDWAEVESVGDLGFSLSSRLSFYLVL